MSRKDIIDKNGNLEVNKLKSANASTSTASEGFCYCSKDSDEKQLCHILSMLQTFIIVCKVSLFVFIFI